MGAGMKKLSAISFHLAAFFLLMADRSIREDSIRYQQSGFSLTHFVLLTADC